MTHAPVVIANPLARRVLNEYVEMPGLQLTLNQAQRLFGLGALECAAVLDFLVERHVLVRLPSGRYARPADGDGRGVRATAFQDGGPLSAR
jgi:hypothetical protein